MGDAKMMKQGLNYEDLNEAQDLVVKMNSYQLRAYWIWVQQHIKDRVKRGLM